MFLQPLPSPIALPPALSAQWGAGLSEGKHWQLSGCWQSQEQQKEQGVMKIVNLIRCICAGGVWQERFQITVSHCHSLSEQINLIKILNSKKTQ